MNVKNSPPDSSVLVTCHARIEMLCRPDVEPALWVSKDIDVEQPNSNCVKIGSLSGIEGKTLSFEKTCPFTPRS